MNQEPIGLWGGTNLYQFAPNTQIGIDPLGLSFFNWIALKIRGYFNFAIKERIMNKICLFTILVFLCFTSAFAKDFFDKKESNMLVSSKNMALELAEIYIKNVYGDTVSINQKPYRIIEEKDVWIINGASPQALGGNFHIVISKKDGRVEKITHSK